MKMVDVDKLSDAELRTKLIECGFPVMPITGTTRNVMAKKLKMLLENKEKLKTDGRRSLGRYSSEEESDTEVKSTKKNRRATMAAPAQPPPERRTNNNDLNKRPSVSKEIKTVTTRTTKIVQSARDEFDTGSDSEPEIIEEGTTVRKTTPPKRATILSFSPRTSLPSSEATSPGGYSSNLSNRYSVSSADRLNQIRSRLNLGDSSYERPSSSFTSTKPSLDTSETPFLSNFTRNLMQLSTGSVGSGGSGDYDYKNDIIKEHDANGSGYSRSLRSRYYKPTVSQRDYYSRDENKILKNNLVSFALVAVAFLFFIVVAIMYLGMRSDSSLEAAGYTIPYCIGSDPKHKRGVNCVTDTDATAAINMLKYLKPHLYNISVTYRCADANVKPFMTEQDVVRFMQSRYPSEGYDMQDVTSLEILTFKNPIWGISVVQVEDGVSDVTESDRVDTMDQMLHNRDYKLTALAVLNPHVPLVCSVYNKLYAIFNAVVFIGGGFFLLFAVNKGVKYYRHHSQKQRDEVFFMVERIIDVLQSNAADGDDNFLVINHVRDMILPIKNRKAMEKVWSKAVKFINENESRVRTEIQHVQGEPYEVWRWLGSPSHNNSGSSPRTKSWQGQAFETQVGSVNSLPCSPTPCLKIRGMIEDGDRNLHTIREAVLSKCAHQCRILHCAVDTNSNCVYLKCADPSDTAVAYRNLHGWWYAGHLVTVKYLRLERYMQRFPDSPASGPPFLKAITPSTDWTN